MDNKVYKEDEIFEYFKASEGLEAKLLMARLEKYLEASSSLLDLDGEQSVELMYLRDNLAMHGTEYKEKILNSYETNTEIPNSVKNVFRKFDCIYSNKVMTHITENQVIESAAKQYNRLNPGGLICHTFWRGDSDVEVNGEKTYYYELEDIRNIFNEHFTILELAYFTEKVPNDSIYIIAQRRGK